MFVVRFSIQQDHFHKVRRKPYFSVSLLVLCSASCSLFLYCNSSLANDMFCNEQLEMCSIRLSWGRTLLSTLISHMGVESSFTHDKIPEEHVIIDHAYWVSWSPNDWTSVQ